MFSGSALDGAFQTLALIAVGAIVLLAARARPKLGVAITLGTIAFVPVWVGTSIGSNGNLFLPAAALVCVLAAVAFIPIRRVRLSPMDGVVAFLLIVTVASLFTGDPGIARAFLFALVLTGVTGYVFGRIAATRVDLQWIYGAIAVTFTIVAGLAIAEFIIGWNPFVSITGNGSLIAEWAPLQERGGIVRAEGAFGHSIALGASIALAIPITYASRFRLWIRGAMLVVMLAATVLTFSRSAIICAVLGLTLALLFLKEAAAPRARIVMAVVAAGSILALAPFAISVYDEAGSEAENSAAYRGDLLALFEHMNLVGLSDLVRRTSHGEIYFQNFRSIDNQFVLTGISVGILGLLVIVAALVVAIVLVVRGRATAATVALVAHIPALASVALITQYSLFLWTVVGLAAAGQAALVQERHSQLNLRTTTNGGLPRLRYQPERTFK